MADSRLQCVKLQVNTTHTAEYVVPSFRTNINVLKLALTESKQIISV
jgi:hypothetical protein